MSMKKSNDSIGNRTRDFSACRAVPQPTALPRGWFWYQIKLHALLKRELNQILNLSLHFKVWPLRRSYLLHISCQGENRSPEHKSNHDTGPPCRLYCGHWALLPRKKSTRGVTITTHLHLLPSPTTRGAASPLTYMHSWLRLLRLSHY